MGETKENFSLEAEQARISTIDGFKQNIAAGIVKNWYMIHPNGDVAPTSENVTRQMEEWINPPADASGNQPKYVNKFGMSVPTLATMEDFGNATARAVDKGTDGGSFWTKVVTFFKAAFGAIGDWMSGKGWTFTENYARITSENISSALEGEVKGLAENPEHRQFIENNKLLDLGKQKIDQAVRIKAGLATSEPAFDLDKLERPAAPAKTNDFTLTSHSGTSQQTVDGIMEAVISSTKQPFKQALDGLPTNEKDKLAAMERKLIEVANTEVAKPAGHASASAFSESVIKKTCKECNIDLGATAADLPMANVLENLGSGTPQQQQLQPLLTRLDSNLKAAYRHLRAAATGKEMSGEELRASQLESQQAEYATNKKTLADMEDTITRKITEQTTNGIVEKVAEGVSGKDGTWYNPLSWGPNSAAISWSGADTYANTVLSAKDNPPTTKSDQENLKASQSKLLEFTSGVGSSPNESQARSIAFVTSHAVLTALKNPETAGDKMKLARAVRFEIENKLIDSHIRIDAMGTPISEINKNRGENSDLFKEVALAISDKIVENKPGSDGRGTYDELAAVQISLLGLQTKIAHGSAALLETHKAGIGSAESHDPRVSPQAPRPIANVDSDRAGENVRKT